MRRRLLLHTFLLLALSVGMAIVFFRTPALEDEKSFDWVATAKVTATGAVALVAVFRFAQAIYRSRGGLIDRRRYGVKFTPESSFQIGPIEAAGQCTLWVECRDMQLSCTVWDARRSPPIPVTTEILDASSEGGRPASLTHHQPEHGRFRIAITLDPYDFHTPVHRNFRITRRKAIGDTRPATVTVEVWGYAPDARLPGDPTLAAYDDDGALKL